VGGVYYSRVGEVADVENRNDAAEAGAPANGDGDTRRRLVHRAVEDWKRQLIDLGGRNNLLYFRDLKVGTLDLGADTASDALRELLAGRKVRLAELFPDPDKRRDAAKRSRALRAKAIENLEERGLQTLRIAHGFATWSTERSAATPSAPILLYELEVKPTGVAADDFELQLGSEPELNPTFLHLLATDFDVHLEQHLLAPGEDDLTLSKVKIQLETHCRSIPSFAVSERTVAGNFSYAKLPMVRDLERSEDEIVGHDLLSAVAGDTEARQSLRDRQSAAEGTVLTPVPPPTDEFLVLDADSSQSYAISAAVAGSNLVIIGPPGTGKSQTISNLIATLVARGRSVLFVAEKRAAIEAVISRLDRRGLGDLLLDLHEGTGNRRRIASELQRALNATGETLAPDVMRLHRQLERRREQLEAYATALREPADPWGVSPFDAQAELIGLSEDVSSGFRVRGPALEALSKPVMTDLRDDTQRFVSLGGAALLRGEGAWATTYAARQVAHSTVAASIQDVLQEVLHVLFPAYIRLINSIRSADIRTPATLDEAAELVALLTDLDEVSRNFTPEVFDLDLPSVVRALQPAKAFAPMRIAAGVFNREFREARRAVLAVAQREGLSDADLLRLSSLTADVARGWEAWHSVRGHRNPAPIRDVGTLGDAREALVRALSELKQTAALNFDTDSDPIAQIEDVLQGLDRERTTLARLPELHQLEDRIRSRALGDVLNEVTRESLPPALAADAMNHVWLSSILDRLTGERAALATFDAVDQQAAVREFTLADQTHIETTVQRVRRAWAERVVNARNEWPGEAQLVAKQAALKRRHMPLRTFFDQAEHVLTAVKPCWVMSPLVVAQVLPARACFDVVIFDEASQVPPSDAACSLLRSHQAVIAGDPHQLPPTSFFSSRADGGDDEEWTRMTRSLMMRSLGR